MVPAGGPSGRYSVIQRLELRMRAVVVFESLYGNTRLVAEEIASGIRAASPRTTVHCLSVGDASSELIADTDLLVVGGPTHLRHMSSGMTRRMGVQAIVESSEGTCRTVHYLEPGAEVSGLRDWFRLLPRIPASASQHHRPCAAAFDTRTNARLAGGAAKGICRRLSQHGYALLAAPQGFVVDDTEGPPHEGELTRAAQWGASLMAALAAEAG